MPILTDSPSPNNNTLCPFCGVETPLEPGKRVGTRHCPRCRRTYPADHLDGVFIDEAADNDHELDDDDTLFEGQNYNWMREYGGEW